MLVPMTRVEWTRLEGNDVEAVVAMFVNREHVDSVRITPSRGDGGVDILDRGAGPDGTDEVHQVKSYTEPLSAKQKGEVEDSLNTLMKDPRWAELNVKVWYLVTPWDPTPEAEAWLRDVGSVHGVTAVWRGLTYVDQLAATYPDIVDYYLHGGRNQIEEAYKTVTAVFGLEQDGKSLDVPEVVKRIEKALPSLDTDPHYRYELRIGEGPLPDVPSRPNLVMSWLAGDVHDGRWTAVDIIARCAASVHERPITITGKFVVESGSDFEKTIRDFFSYGAPFTSPPGVYQGEVDAPGGLGGSLDRATVTTLPVADDLGHNPELHLEVLDPDGTVLAAVDVDRVDRSQGKDGVRVVLEELHHVFTIEDRYNLTEERAIRSVRFGDFTGEPVGPVRSALHFVSHCQPPNVGRLSARHTPPELGVLDKNLGFEWSEEMQQTLTSTINALDSLAVIQRHTSTPIRVPDFGALPPGQVKRWRFAEKILLGEDVTVTYPAGHCLIIELEADITAPGETFGISLPLMVDIGGQSIDLGRIEAWLTSPTLIERKEHQGRIYYSFTTPDRSVRCHRPHDHPPT
jgi:hypothetical protein